MSAVPAAATVLSRPGDTLAAMGRLTVVALIAGLMLASCASIDDDTRSGVTSTVLPSPSVVTSTSAGPTPTTSTTTTVPEPTPIGTAPEAAEFTVVASHPHDDDAFTQGLLFWADRFVESTGPRGESDLRVVDPDTGEVLESQPLDDRFWGEGLARVDDRLVQLTWEAGTAFVWDLSTLELETTFTYNGEGWGLCHDGGRLVMSNGSSFLTFRDPDTFAVTGSIEVTWAGSPIGSLNELECIDGRVWANVWKDTRILIIDPTTGAVSHVLDASELVPTVPEPQTDVLNGIAHDPATGRIWVTGKDWPVLYELDVELP